MDAHSNSMERLFDEFKSSPTGLTPQEVKERKSQYGANIFPTKTSPPFVFIFLRQFANPLIYILLVVVVISLVLRDYTDALFISLVLIVNAVIGAIQEYGSERSSQALKNLSATMALVEREGEISEIDSVEIVPGDIVVLDSGRKVPADLRLFHSQSLEVDESLLTGESLPVFKSHDLLFSGDLPLGERKNMAFAGSLVVRGRGKGLVVKTGLGTELGGIVESLTQGAETKPPLIERMEKFTRKLALILLIFAVGMSVYLLWQGQAWQEVLMFSVALAVSAIPEGLPVALTVALSVASRKMSKRNVIVRQLPAVEALGSCTYVATDKTGTLTVNQLTIQKLLLANFESLEVSGSGLQVQGDFFKKSQPIKPQDCPGFSSLMLAGILCNESQLVKKNEKWLGQGDAVDLAFLVLAHKAQIHPEEIRDRFALKSEIPFEPENQFAATLHEREGQGIVSVKGALEKILPMCVSINMREIQAQSDLLAEAGYRVLALAGDESANLQRPLAEQLQNLSFFGLVAMIDPLRPEASKALRSCQEAGIQVAILTGDHPKTALAISRQLGLAKDLSEVVTGLELKNASPENRAKMIETARVFARVEPRQKLEIVNHLKGQGRFVAVTGDGANDAPALRAAHVGVAMGKNGTDVAKEASDLILTDDRFASIVAGVEEGRIAYSNIRKVIYLLIATGAAEILMVILSFVFQTPLPLTAVQLLWLNLVTNGIQDAALAFEPGEGDELSRPPRHPRAAIFDRLMIERVVLSALVMGAVSFYQFYLLIQNGESEFSARNQTLLLMVLFENVMIGNCRSETKSAFSLSPLRNPFLLLGTLGALAVHTAGMSVPQLSSVLQLEPVSLSRWLELLIWALSVLVVMEIHKVWRRRS